VDVRLTIVLDLSIRILLNWPLANVRRKNLSSIKRGGIFPLFAPVVFESGYLPIGEEDFFCCIGSLLPAGPVAELVMARKMKESPFEITSRDQIDHGLPASQACYKGRLSAKLEPTAR
jgi:hypothetical protein